MSSIKTLFWNREEARLRAGWRIITYIVLWLILARVVFGLSDTMHIEGLPEVYRTPLIVAAHILVVLIFLWGLVGSRLLDRRSIADYGFHLNKSWWLDLGFGISLGALLMLGIFVVELLIGWTDITDIFVVANPGQNFGPMILVVFSTVALIASEEEIMYRGYILRNWAEGLKGSVISPRVATFLALVLSSVVFGLAHAPNLNATLLSTVNTMALAALILGAGYVLTGELALPIGFHIAWNCVQLGVGYLGGATVLGAAFFSLSEHGPELWTGGVYGHENGLLATCALILGFLLLVAWVRLRRGSVRLDPSIAKPPARLAVSGSNHTNYGKASSG